MSAESAKKHFAAGGVVIDAQSRVLLVEPKGHFDGYVWTFPKGRPNVGETAERAATREVLEESGIVAEIVGLVPKVFEGGTTQNVYFVMSATSDSGTIGEESQSRRWATPDEAAQLIGQTTNVVGRARDLAVLRAAVELAMGGAGGDTRRERRSRSSRSYRTSEETRKSIPYDALKEQLGAEMDLEPSTVLEACEAHRVFWKPRQVRVVLLAESHVFTDGREVNHEVDLGSFGYPDAPKEFVRLVYCLGYGEPELLKRSLPRNPGTWQYWKLFWACLNDPGAKGNGFAAQLLKGNTTFAQRVANKLKLLEALRDRGIWLLDASLPAVYGQHEKPSIGVIDKSIRVSWELHLRERLLECRPAAVVVIGKGVHKTLRQDLAKMPVEQIAVINQPAAHTSAATKLTDLKTLYAVCSRHAASRRP